jgi:hypothetical protein
MLANQSKGTVMKSEEIFAYAINDNRASNEDHDDVSIEFGVATTNDYDLMGPYIRVDGALYRVTKTKIDTCFLLIWATPITDQEAIDECVASERGTRQCITQKVPGVLSRSIAWLTKTIRFSNSTGTQAR